MRIFTLAHYYKRRRDEDFSILIEEYKSSSECFLPVHDISGMQEMQGSHDFDRNSDSPEHRKLKFQISAFKLAFTFLLFKQTIQSSDHLLCEISHIFLIFFDLLRQHFA